MSTWIHRLALASWRARRRVVAAWLALLVALGGLAVVTGGSFDDEFRIPGASSQQALDELQMTFPEAAMSSASIVVIAPPGTTFDDPAIHDEIEAARTQLETIEWVAMAQSPYNEYVHGLISDDRTAALVNVRVDGYSVSTFTDAQRAELIEAGEKLQAEIPGSVVHVGGDLFSVNLPRITPVEGIGVAVALVVLMMVLGSLRAGLIPIVSALVGSGVSMLLIKVAASVVAINSTTLMLALMLGLAVGIDYSLFIVSRHRDQLATGMDAAESAGRATATAGSAVVFAGLTVIIALVGLGVAGIPFLTTMGVFAAVAVAIQVALALTWLPAMLGFSGEKLRPRAARAALAAAAAAEAGDESSADEASAPDADVAGAPDADEAAPARRRFDPSRWWVGVVTRVPALTIAVVVVALGALAIPAQHLQLALPNSGHNEPTAADRITFDVISERFGVGYNGPLVITGSIVESDDPLGLVDELKADVEAVPGVHMVAMAVPNPDADTALIQIIPETGPDDPRTAELVHRLGDLTDRWKAERGLDMATTGYTAVAIDVSAQLGRALVPFGLFVVGLSLVLLTVMFRSIAVPIKAALGYLLSVGAAFGLTTLVFNQGVGAHLINLHEPQPVISFLPIILMGILFGLAMDYEVFLTSRMREEYVHGNHESATEEGFVHSAKVVVAAAVIMMAVFGFFIPEGNGTIKPIAFGLAVGVAIDAFFVRMTLGPAIMRLLGDRAWWLPAWLERRLPVLDAEGEAITHQLELADWPAPDSRSAIHAEGLAAATHEVSLFERLDLDVAPGGVLLVTGTPASRRALTLALSGRLALSGGNLKVLGLVLPQQGGELRRRATFVDAASPDAARALADPVGDLVVVDDADRLDAAGRAALARLIAASTDAGAARTVVLAGEDAEALARPAGAADTTLVTLDTLSTGGTR